MIARPGPLADIAEAGGLGLRVFDLDGGGLAGTAGSSGLVRLGVSRAPTAPAVDVAAFDLLLSADPSAAAPWVGCAPERLDATRQAIEAAVAAQPVAAAVACQVLRASLKLSFDEALAQESLAYSMLLASDGFSAWRAAHPPRGRPIDASSRVAIERDADALVIRLTRPASRNAVDARMRDALAEALQFALDDPDAAPVVLSGEGPSFCAGGDLDEFGSAADPGQAHAIRLLRSATALAHRLGPRLTVRTHGACIGAGIEIPAAAGRVVAAPDAVFRLPEVGMGLIPGAGGTASIPRRIGRHRAAFMALSGWDIDAATALAWGLVDAVEGAAA